MGKCFSRHEIMEAGTREDGRGNLQQKPWCSYQFRMCASLVVDVVAVAIVDVVDSAHSHTSTVHSKHRELQIPLELPAQHTYYLNGPLFIVLNLHACKCNLYHHPYHHPYHPSSIPSIIHTIHHPYRAPSYCTKESFPPPCTSIPIQSIPSDPISLPEDANIGVTLTWVSWPDSLRVRPPGGPKGFSSVASVKVVLKAQSAKLTAEHVYPPAIWL